jgi:hypothetical protein
MPATLQHHSCQHSQPGRQPASGVGLLSLALSALPGAVACLPGAVAYLAHTRHTCSVCDMYKHGPG